MIHFIQENHGLLFFYQYPVCFVLLERILNKIKKNILL